ncbi:GNAT family N-acetyltransferase [Luteolibacter arcticus]|uniref:GNAT family N-acetyltransferase n=1 Tax=Luteolibacter arcticus TaxID=1581411 RepID=A0ABT3GNT1_9BACT|nr:GNAT family N-acetyltransferase [Luteolibacter arcticus]MCW1925136.1 GNAT family N-acetyltransferase [Luteolibacter arcticus]
MTTSAPHVPTSHDLNALGQPVGFPVPDWQPPSSPSGEPMKGRFCRLEKLDPVRHATSLHAANALDAEGWMWTYLGYGPFESEEAYRAWTAEVSEGNDPLFFAILDRANGKAIGVASYLRIDPQVGSIEVGHLAYSPLLKRSPAATEAMFLMMARAFDLGYRRYEWKCDALNAPSRAAARRLGFTFEGNFRQATIVKGRNRDTAWFSITDQEWPALRKSFERWLVPANFDDEGNQRERLSELTVPRAPVIRRASAAETGIVSAILTEAAQWLSERGEPLWKAGELSPEAVGSGVSDGLFHLAWIGDEAAGVFKMQDEDQLFWPDVPQREAIYLHRIAVRREHAGSKVMDAMIGFARQATMATGRRYLRLDCEASRPKLCALYEKRGFVKHSERQVGPYFVARYQCEVGA